MALLGHKTIVEEDLLIQQTAISTRDEIVQMFLRRISKMLDRAKEELETLRGKERATTEHLIKVFTDVLHTTTETLDNIEM